MFKKNAIAGVFAATCLLAGVKPAAAQTIYSPAELTEVPHVASASQAQREVQNASRSLLESGVKGKVQLRFVVNANGKVDPASVEVVATTQDALRGAAKEAIKKISFVPGKKDGTAVATQVLITLSIGQ